MLRINDKKTHNNGFQQIARNMRLLKPAVRLPGLPGHGAGGDLSKWVSVLLLTRVRPAQHAV